MLGTGTLLASTGGASTVARRTTARASRAGVALTAASCWRAAATSPAATKAPVAPGFRTRPCTASTAPAAPDTTAPPARRYPLYCKHCLLSVAAATYCLSLAQKSNLRCMLSLRFHFIAKYFFNRLYMILKKKCPSRSFTLKTMLQISPAYYLLGSLIDPK